MTCHATLEAMGIREDGFALAIYDVQALSKGIRAEADAIGEHVRVVRSSGVERTDFGDGGDTVGAAYVRTVHGTLAGSLDAFRAASEDLAERLTAISRRYESIEDSNWGRLLDVDRAGR